MLNRVVLIGNLTRDPELRYTQNGAIAVVRFTVAVNRPFTNQQGEYEADFINIVAWRNVALNVHKFLGKGSLIAIEGRLQTRSYEAQDGRTVYVTEVVADTVRFLKTRNRQSQGTPQPQQTNKVQSKEQPQIDIDRELPF